MILLLIFLFALWASLSGLFYFVVADWFAAFNGFPDTAWVIPLFESFMLSLLFLLVYSLTRRKRLSALLTTLFYLAFMAASVTKIHLLGTPIFINDALLLGDLVRTWDEFKTFIPYLLVVLVLAVWLIRHETRHTEADDFNRWAHFCGILAALVTLSYVFNAEIRLFLREHNIYFKTNSNLAKRSFKTGLLSGFVQSAFFTGRMAPPPGYAFTTTEQLYQKYALNTPNQAPAQGQNTPTNVIVLMVESLTNPKDFGWYLEQSAIPHFESMMAQGHTGHVLSPVFGGKSINAEFELITGLSNVFNPPESTPYHEYVDSPMHSLYRAFSQNGYHSNVVQMVQLGGFGYSKAYNYLGIDQKVSIVNTDEGIDPDPSARSVASHSTAQTIFSLTDAQDKSFVFAFPNSSHAPWHLDHYPNHTLALTEPLANKKEGDLLLAYFNALHHVDQLFGMLLEKYRDSDETTLIAIVGDHQPILPFYNRHLGNHRPQDDILNRYQTPYVIWANYPLPTVQNSRLMSMNFLAAMIVEVSGIQVSGFMKFLTTMRKEYALVSHLIAKHDGVPLAEDELDQLVQDYRYFQYDILFGENHLATLENITE